MRDDLPGMWEDADLSGGWADSVTAADRPSVTDNARAEEQSEYTVQQTAAHFARRVQRVSDRIRSTDYQRSVSDLVALDVVEGFLDRIARDDLDVFAAARAETTTATTEEAWEVITRVRDAYPRVNNDAPTGEIVAALADAGLLATARTRPTREHVRSVMRQWFSPDDYRIADKVTDAVLALWADRPTEAEAGARALEQAAEAVYTDSAPSLAPWLLTRASHLRAGER